ncbi:non-specific lipid-transfer protein-like protein At5g64080 [Olea europaea var. sylvestris]|uniref:Bifunctional inhibitor/plant lipid transfer protein/seed storage helical domain-containing protein n=1 Tax=Olea europaea subsp. europaea TaxID=158383 RepID=A0A8S0U3K8_OLEEU|nr:non-specific lipid-transfer protein-like protein At5g64080 [Olea europaea var. sylvestris]CAA3013224.1 Hypothetical predicted protein [Olea europaea subsp. europaea]
MKTLVTALCILVAVASGCTEHNQGSTPVHLQPPTKAPAPATSVDCTSLMFNMVDCITFLGNGGIELKPDMSCCSGFKMAVYKNSDCVCKALKIGVILGIDFNMTMAMKLPSACGLSSFKLTGCKVKTPSIAAPPQKSPDVPTPTKPHVAPSGRVGTPEIPSGHAGTPAPPHATNGAYTTRATFSIIFSLVVSASSFFNVLA